MNKQFSIALIVLLTLLALTGCAGGPVAKEYTSRQIDQPYVLPQGMKAFTFGASYWITQLDSETASALNLPLYWRVPVAKKSLLSDISTREFIRKSYLAGNILVSSLQRIIGKWS